MIKPQAIDPSDICTYLLFSTLFENDLLLPQAIVSKIQALNLKYPLIPFGDPKTPSSIFVLEITIICVSKFIRK